MPKELIHFKVALKTAAKLTESRLGKSLDAHPHGLLLGAVLHDALFYSISSKAHPLIHLAHRFHGADGHDTYTLLRLQAEHAAQAKEPDLPTALLVGMASHLAADTTLHPLVWHLSGHYFSPDQRTRSNARQRHRALESLMDMVACPEMIGRPLFSIRRLVHRLGDDMYHALPISQLAELAGSTPEQFRTGLAHAFTVFGTLQALFPVTPLARALWAALPYLPMRAAEVATLFYAPQLMKQSNQISGTINYRHPVTKTPSSVSLSDMIEDAATQARNLCSIFEKTIFLDQPLILKQKGPSLDTGSPDSDSRDMHCFADPLFPKLP